MMQAIPSSRKRERSMPFISTWKTDNLSTGSSSILQISLPVYEEGIYDFHVNWGDGTSSHINKYDQPEVTHTYALPGTYTITIKGTLFGFRFADLGDKLKLLSVQQWGCLRIGNLGYTFMGCANLNIPEVTDILNLKGVTNLSYLFCYCRSLANVNRIDEWDISEVISLKGVFYEAVIFNQSINNWNTANVVDMGSAFQFAYLFNQPLNNWNLSNVTSIYQLFRECTHFNQDLNNWNVSKISNMQGVFFNALIFNRPLNNWDVSKAENMQSMFYLATNFNQPLNNWNTGNVTNMAQMFGRAIAFNQPIYNWNTSNVTNMTNMFRLAADLTGSFNQDISSWDTSNVTNMFYMFAYNTVFNKPLNNWNVSKVTDMTAMFRQCTAFNQPLDNWNVTSVISFTSFMLSKSYLNYSSANYNALLNTWSMKDVQPGRAIHFGSIRYTAAGQTGRNILTSQKGWTISDGGMTT